MQTDGPLPPREAFEETSSRAHHTQAAVLLSVGALVAGEPDVVSADDGEDQDLPLPAPQPLAHPAPIPLARAVRRLDVTAATYSVGAPGGMDRQESARLTRRLYDDPDVETAAALVESGMHSSSTLVRTAAAVAALDTTGPREDVGAVLESSASARDPDVRELARIGLARTGVHGTLLSRYTIARPRIRRRRRPSHTAVVSHGTFAARSRWWRPGGDLHTYLDGLAPPLHLHDESFGWSGAYSHIQREVAATDMVQWVPAQQLDRPDWFAHSHGATVANLATQQGLDLGRLVWMACPVHTPWLPDLDRVTRLIDVRVRADLVIIADRGRQRLPAVVRADPRVTELRNGWFSHSAPREPSYWDDHDLPDRL